VLAAEPRPVAGTVNLTARTVLLTGVAALGLGAWVTMRPEQPWILWLTAGLVALATDGLIRRHPHWGDEGTLGSIVYTFLPALGVLGSGLFIDHAIDGYARPVTALGSALRRVVVFGEVQDRRLRLKLYGAFRS